MKKLTKNNYEYGYSFHYYLRKYVDTSWASMMYGLVHIIEPKVWGNFCEWSQEKLHSSDYNNPKFKFSSVIREWVVHIEDGPLTNDPKLEEIKRNHSDHLWTFVRALDIMDKESAESLDVSFQCDLK